MYDLAVDIWALGCSIVETFTRKPTWNLKPGINQVSLLSKIGVIDELRGIPQVLSEEGKDFLGKCFVKDPKRRWMDEMLLDHPFMDDDDETVSLNRCEEEELTSQRCSFKKFSSSLKCHFEFPERISIQSTTSSQSSPVPLFSRLRCPLNIHFCLSYP
ncbi:hypothetical protein V6N13_139812 [Hibiscus sabdariffa]|uniref:Protein kinase domain-containing protein n=2 Tax=Hibiscus sabdariffa TaxID=183260 RepID=A0ABR2B2Z1_9ROSI